MAPLRKSLALCPLIEGRHQPSRSEGQKWVIWPHSRTGSQLRPKRAARVPVGDVPGVLRPNLAYKTWRGTLVGYQNGETSGVTPPGSLGMALGPVPSVRVPPGTARSRGPLNQPPIAKLLSSTYLMSWYPGLPHHPPQLPRHPQTPHFCLTTRPYGHHPCTPRPNPHHNLNKRVKPVTHICRVPKSGVRLFRHDIGLHGYVPDLTTRRGGDPPEVLGVIS